MGITFSHQTIFNDFVRKKIHRLNLDLIVKVREIRLKEVARIAAVEAASVKKAEWEKPSAQLSECSIVVQILNTCTFSLRGPPKLAVLSDLRLLQPPRLPPSAYVFSLIHRLLHLLKLI